MDQSVIKTAITSNHSTFNCNNTTNTNNNSNSNGVINHPNTSVNCNLQQISNNEENKKQGTRVFKKSSPNGKVIFNICLSLPLVSNSFFLILFKICVIIANVSIVEQITVYLGKRDFVDHMNYIDPIDGVVLIDPDYIKERKVYGHVLAAFRYGREDLDVLGLTFRKDLFLSAEQIFPTKAETRAKPLTRLQERLIKKLGTNAYPFFFELPPNCPASVTLQPAPGDTGKPCGVDYELKAYVADSVNDKPHKRNSVRLAIRKVVYAPSKQGDQPCTEVSKDFVMSPNKLHLEASLDKELYHHGEDIVVNVHIANNSNRTVKKIKVSVRQFADICLFSTAQYKCTVAEIESEDGCPVSPGFTLSKVYNLKPLLANNKDKRGLALDGQLKHEDTNLASSTIINDLVQKENLGIIVRYKVKVKLILGPLGGDVVAELPFILMHPKPEEPKHNDIVPKKNDRMQSNSQSIDNNIENNSNSANNDGHLIQLDEDNDDIIFEDFARLRLKGNT
ncbi:Beta-arrestin-1 [Sarcoptes scabiei]|uniref:Beta-arrestin-1 n=1 Tax=Sarcoptes scabiei TaxID=52283 RepID=A0A834VCI7_SARSC|nr:Beta-arrestin-1 [Sarcoptes scabiei]